MFLLKGKRIITNSNGSCGSTACNHKEITKGERVVWTVHLHREQTISRVWHLNCHDKASRVSPSFAKLLEVQQNRGPFPQQYFDQRRTITKEV